jgi:beta-glucosidase/6-phospho-beta-glucosidase/beta-galactosidase
LQAEFGGWLDEQIVDIFGDFADFAFSNFGDRVRIKAKDIITYRHIYIQNFK